MLLAACANGDFGRIKPSLVSDDIHAWIGVEAASAAAVPVSIYPLTDEERQLRDLAYPLIEPPYRRNRWYSIVNEYGVSRVFNRDWFYRDTTVYSRALGLRPYRSASGRYAKLNEDIRNDVVRIPAFFAAARRVLDLDRKREKSLAYIAALNGQEWANATARAAENALVIGWVQQSFANRVESYRYALERLVVATPSPMAVEAERSLTLLQSQIAENRVLTGPVIVPGAATPVAAEPEPSRTATRVVLN